MYGLLRWYRLLDRREKSAYGSDCYNFIISRLSYLRRQTIFYFTPTLHPTEWLCINIQYRLCDNDCSLLFLAMFAVNILFDKRYPFFFWGLKNIYFIPNDIRHCIVVLLQPTIAICDRSSIDGHIFFVMWAPRRRLLTCCHVIL